MRPNWGKVWLFYAATFVVTHGASMAYVLAGGSWGDPASYVVANALMLCPGMVAVLLQYLVFREPVAAPLGLRFRPNAWFLFAWFLPPFVMYAALGLSLLLPGATFAADMSGLPPEMDAFRTQVASLGMPPLLGMLGVGLVLGPSLNAVGGLGEELGWRGLLFAELSPLGFWKCSAITGSLWAFWHVPLLFEGGYGDREHPIANAMGTLAFAALAAPILHLVRARSGSVVACGIFHGTMSSTRLLSVAFVRNAGPWANAAIPVALLVVSAAISRIFAREASVAPTSGRAGSPAGSA